jgi:exopolyphosphatase/guanosine-5'-triphosphate,3'-diphosphate pyrophosphatase
VLRFGTGDPGLERTLHYDHRGMRVGVVDIGTNSTRLLICDVHHEGIHELDRRSQVTRLGDGVDASGELSEESMQRVFATLDAYRDALDEQGCETAVAVLTSAVRDAANGADFTDEVRGRYGLEARTIDGEEEAQLTFRGATAGRASRGEPLLVIDVGGGSTELVIGEDHDVSFHVSTQTGVVRGSERHLKSDPPAPEELQALGAEVRSIVEDSVPDALRASVVEAIGVAGTATSCASIEQELDPYDPNAVQGYVLELGSCELLLARLAAMPLAERREVVGLHPDRAPTIVAGVLILIEVLRTFGLEQMEVSEHDLMWGAALRAAANPP